MRAIRSGHLYTAVDGAATPASFEFTATNEHGTVNEGDEIGVGGPVTLRVRSNAPPEFTTMIWNGSGPVFSTDHHAQDFTVQAPPEPAVYWAEIRATGRPTQVAWVRSNPIYIRSPEAVERATGPSSRDAERSDLRRDRQRMARRATISLSVAAVERAPSIDGAELRLRYGLAGGASVGQVVALAFDAPAGVAAYDSPQLLDSPPNTPCGSRCSCARATIKGRHPASAGSGRCTSIPQPRDRTIFFDDLMPVGETHTPKPIAAGIRTILFVIDATNTTIGGLGQHLDQKKLALER